MNEFKVNNYLTLKLERKKTNIYVGGTLFFQCKFLLLEIPVEENLPLNEIESIDEAAEILDSSQESNEYDRSRRGAFQIPPEVEFWGHCSNLQAWYENNYDTRLLHRNLAFPLLKKLTEAGDPDARKAFKLEIAKRLESGNSSVVAYLLEEDYLDFFSTEELNATLIDYKIFDNALQFGPKDDYLALCKLLRKIKEISTEYFKQLLKDLIKEEDPKLHDCLEEKGWVYQYLTTEEIVFELLSQEEATIVLELESLMDEKFAFSINNEWVHYNTDIVEKKVFGISLNHIKLSLFPEQILRLKHLKYLNLASNVLQIIPASIDTLKELQYLNMSDNKLASIPDSIGNLNKLQALDLINNNLIAIPDSIGNLKKLRRLFLDRNEFVSVPNSIGNLGKLEYLDLSENKLPLIPESIGNLKALIGLNLRENDLASLPESIGHLESLQQIDFRENDIKNVPESIADRKGKGLSFWCVF